MPHPAASPSSGLTRRQFGKKAITAGVTAALAVAPLGCEFKTPTGGKGETDSESDARYQQVMRRYGHRLSDEQRKRVRKIVAYNETLLAPIRAFPLDNGQPAATVLKFYEEERAAQRTSGRRLISKPEH